MLLASGCGLEDVAPATAHPSLMAATDSAWQRMHSRFSAAYQLEEAVSRGDLLEIRAQAARLSQLTEPDPLPRWKPGFDQVVNASRQLKTVTDVVAAARLTAALGRQCARCHEQQSTKIHISRGATAVAGDDLSQQMRRHQWAASHMWEGLIGPSDELWNDGARELTTVPLFATSASTTVAPDGVNADIARVRVDAQHALETSDQDARRDIFGDLLATCAHCHVAIRGH